MNPPFLPYPLRDRRGYRRELTTLRLDVEGRILGTWTFGRTGCCEGAARPAVVSIGPTGKLLQLAQGLGQHVRDELRRVDDGPVYRRRLRKPNYPEMEPLGDSHPVTQPSSPFNALWLNDREWVLLDLLAGPAIYRCRDLQVMDRVYGPETLQPAPPLGLVPGPDGGWGTLRASTEYDGTNTTHPTLLGFDADCQLLWTVNADDVAAAVTWPYPNFSLLRYCLDNSGRPVLGWETANTLDGEDESVAGLATDGTLRWRVRCPVAWYDGPLPVATKSDQVQAIASGSGGRVAVLWYRRQWQMLVEDPPEAEIYHSAVLSVLDDAGGEVWSRELVPWQINEPGVYLNARFLLFEGERIYLMTAAKSLLDEDDRPEDQFARLLCLNAATGATLWGRQFRYYPEEADDNTNYLFPFSMAAVPGGGLVLGFDPFFAPVETRAP